MNLGFYMTQYQVKLLCSRCQSVAELPGLDNVSAPIIAAQGDAWSVLRHFIYLRLLVASWLDRRGNCLFDICPDRINRRIPHS